MYCCEKENYWIEVNNTLLNFYNKENKIYLDKYEKYKLVEQKIIYDNCDTLSTVILSSNGDISLIYINLNGELVLSSFINGKLENSIILIREAPKNSYMQIASVNNSLNIFYINEVNDISTICFRVLSNRLTLTPAVIIDGIDTKCDIPYIISADNDKLAICYVKIGYPHTIGYRTYDIKKSLWSNFKELAKCNFPISNFDFVIKDDIIAYSYTFANYRKENLICGIGKNENIKNNLIQESSPKVNLSDIYISKDNKLCLIYLLEDALKIMELEINREIKTIKDISLKNISYYNKYSYSCDKEISKNTIINVKAEDLNIFTDSNFVNSILSEDNAAETKLSSDEEDSPIVEENLSENICTFNLDEYIKPYITKIEEYEASINEIKEKLNISQDEKKKLMDNIEDLNTQLTEKDNEVSDLQNSLEESEVSLSKYEDKIKDLTKKLNEKDNSTEKEVIALKEIIDQNKIEKTNFIKIIEEKDEVIKSINENLEIKEKDFQALQVLIEENKKIENESKQEISKLNKKVLELIEDYTAADKERNEYLTEISNLEESIDYLNQIINSNNDEINFLKNNIDELNQVIEDNNNKINSLNNEIESLKEDILFFEERARSSESFIRKLFKNE